VFYKHDHRLSTATLDLAVDRAVDRAELIEQLRKIVEEISIVDATKRP